MCGIFALANIQTTSLPNTFIGSQAQLGQKRGPDNYKVHTTSDIFLAFYRLAINGIDDKSNQPLHYNNKILICNGEIYNHHKLFEMLGVKAISNSDCEVIIHLYEKFGIDYTLNLLDGVYAFVLIDNDIDEIFIARDALGVRPLFCLKNSNTSLSEEYSENKAANLIGFASELKQLNQFTENHSEYNYEGNSNLVVNQFSPGSIMHLKLAESAKWTILSENKFFNFNLSRLIPSNEEIDQEYILCSIHEIFVEAVHKRVANTDRPIACLLSGGLDSSIVAALVSRIYNQTLETYSIGLEGSEDLKYARDVAKFIKSNHTEVIVSEDDFFAFIPNTIYNIESYDTTTVRASVGNLLVSQYISEVSEAKVIFNGDGSDELMGGYLYMSHAPTELEFDQDCKRLLNNINYFDVLRSDKSISSCGLEPRTPFLDRDFITFYLSIPVQYRYAKNKIQEKYLFRKAFDRGYLPKEVLWRKKEAFSDGVSKQDRSWYEIIQEKVNTQKDVKYDLDKTYHHNPPESMEQLYYRTIFEKAYPNQGHVIPYMWMPKFVEATDSSARTLDIYNSTIAEELDDLAIEDVEETNDV